ncbi:MAG: hypothetical protein M0P71_12080 [Melioribacteraceae bacterium]|jgi:hypothetical protein|nr:hypothetical protein [Melioribacteraceae bacterium]
MKKEYSFSMVDLVSRVLASGVEDVLSSTLVMDLLSAYSALYLNGANPRLCGRCHKDYYFKLKKDGLMKAIEFDKAKNRTCKPKWNGLRFIPKLGKHINSELITDEQAEKLLKEGHLMDKDFTVLPGIKAEEPAKVKKTRKNKQEEPAETEINS